MPTPDFYAALITIGEQARGLAIARAAPGVYPRPWQLPPGPSVDIQDPAYLAEALNRDELNAEYTAAFAAVPVKARGATMALKASIDYLAAYERALHARHAGPARLRAWASARRAGHGVQGIGVLWSVARQIEIWAAGNADTIESNELVGE